MKNTKTKIELNKNIYISEGNRKLGRNENEYFLIWNLPAVTTCPYRTSQCEKLCYAKKAERIYPQVLPCRERNFIESQKTSFSYDMIQSIKAMINKPKNKGKQAYFRIHESGDFYNQEYVNKWIYIASQIPEVQFMAYTKSVKYFEHIMDTIPKNMVIRFSLWEDTDPKSKKLADKLQLPIYTAFEKHELDNIVLTTAYLKCECDCTVCKKCYSNECKKIAVAIH